VLSAVPVVVLFCAESNGDTPTSRS